jgi:ABC-type multidrug transport system fused ATPase/permease subunit
MKTITYYYPTRPETLVLNNFNVSAKRGQSIAIVGPSGGGKSTVVQLIERFYDVFSGVVVCMSKVVPLVMTRLIDTLGALMKTEDRGCKVEKCALESWLLALCQ